MPAPLRRLRLDCSQRKYSAIQVPPEKVAAELHALGPRLDEVEVQASKWRFPGSSINAVTPPGHGQGRS